MKRAAKRKPAKRSAMRRKTSGSIKSHEKLGITYAEFGALMGVRAMLEDKALTFAKPNPWGGTKAKPSTHQFNMNTVCKRQECGSVGCIGGNMALILGSQIGTPETFVSADRQSPLTALFFPPDPYDYSVISSRQAIEAINNFLRTGSPMWRKVLGSVRVHNAKRAA